MIWMIAQKELLENFYSLRFRVVALLCISVMTTGNFVLLHDYQKRMEDYFLNLPKAGEARVVIKPSVLSLYAAGLQKNMGRGYDIRPGTLIMLPSATILNPNFFSSRFAVPDMAYLVKVFLSLLAVLIAFDAICNEKMQGTFRLLLSNGVPRTQVVLGKILGNLITIWMPFTFAFIFGLALITLAGKTTITTEDLARIGFFYLGSVLYLSIFVLLAVTVSARTSISSTSLVICLFLWTILTFGIPNLSSTIARASSHLPSAQALEEEKLLTYALKNEWLSAEGKMNKTETHQRIQQIENDYRNLLDRYVETTRKVSRLSPTSSYLYFASSICQSGFEDERRLKQYVLRYRDALLENPEKVSEIQFTYSPLKLPESLQNVIIELLMLLMFTGFFFAASYTSFIRYDVR
ncbi:MAG: ABC transporter permease [candidate division KSB1 bacterium]|nr:ABC transporter permease [candidate division KSB1 bacterium]MDZ7365229.1 ABC transporter permease [candidate division KSB1 bacterium]MDZ7407258.1 ABC transporter permease [candidate division KSB1 bacterium]